MQSYLFLLVVYCPGGVDQVFFQAEGSRFTGVEIHFEKGLGGNTVLRYDLSIQEYVLL